jgi:hypothetical protein
MTKLFALTIILIASFSCKKETDNCLKEVPMSLKYSVVPSNATANSSFNVELGVFGSDLCWKYLRTEVKTLPNNIFELRCYGSYPCKPRACSLAIYEASDIINIPTTNSGTYRVDIYSNNSLLVSNNVIVN